MIQQNKNIGLSTLQRLQETAGLSNTFLSIQEKAEESTKAFHLLIEEAVRLEQSYTKLQEHFLVVNTQLQENQMKLQEKTKQFEEVSQSLEDLLKFMQEGVLIIDRDGKINKFNTFTDRLFDLKHKLSATKNFWEVFPDKLFGFSLRQALLEQSLPEVTQINHLTAQEEEKYLEITPAFLGKSSNTFQGLLLFIKDISEMRLLQKKEMLGHRMKELGEMTACVAHEIRNPLGGIEGFASLLYKDLSKDPQHQKMATYIIEGAKTISRLVESILDYARPLSPKLESVNLIPFLQELSERIELDGCVAPSVKIEWCLEETELYVALDKQLFRLALINLILNSSQAMPKGGVITLTARRKEENAFLSIRDSGMGIDPKNLDRIFSPFFTTKPKGTGLGLYEVYKIVQSHYGRIEVASKIHLGTTFTITLPIRG